VVLEIPSSRITINTDPITHRTWRDGNTYLIAIQGILGFYLSTLTGGDTAVLQFQASVDAGASWETIPDSPSLPVEDEFISTQLSATLQSGTLRPTNDQILTRIVVDTTPNVDPLTIGGILLNLMVVTV
jgi:hypothetical protein